MNVVNGENLILKPILLMTVPLLLYVPVTVPFCQSSELTHLDFKRSDKYTVSIPASRLWENWEKMPFK